MLTLDEETNSHSEGDQWPAPGLGTDCTRSRSVAIRWRAMSFSSTTVEWPFLLGAEYGTVPLGREVRNRDGSTLLLGLCAPRWSFLLSREEHREAKRTKKRSRWERRRAMESVKWKVRIRNGDYDVCLIDGMRLFVCRVIYRITGRKERKTWTSSLSNRGPLLSQDLE